MKNKIKFYALAILLPLAVGGISAFLTKNNMDIYDSIKTPPLSPPSVVFPIVWSVLYLLMGVSSALVFYSSEATNKEKSSALTVYLLSLAANFLWSIVFFNFRAFFTAFAVLAALLVLVVVTVLKYKKINLAAAYLQVPYLIWVAFAGYLNFGIWLLNCAFG